MSKVSAPTFVVCGLGDPKVRPIGVADGLRVNIPVLGCMRLTWGGTMMDNVCPDLKSGSKHQDSGDRQIRHCVYSRCDGSAITQVKVEMRDFIILEKLRKKYAINSY